MQSVADTALVGGHHVLNVDESVFAPVLLEHFERLLDQVAQDHLLALGVVDSVPGADSALLKEIHHWQDLAEVRHKRFAHCVVARH